jgi:hypothetical protein
MAHVPSGQATQSLRGHSESTVHGMVLLLWHLRHPMAPSLLPPTHRLNGAQSESTGTRHKPRRARRTARSDLRSCTRPRRRSRYRSRSGCTSRRYRGWAASPYPAPRRSRRGTRCRPRTACRRCCRTDSASRHRRRPYTCRPGTRNRRCRSCRCWCRPCTLDAVGVVVARRADLVVAGVAEAVQSREPDLIPAERTRRCQRLGLRSRRVVQRDRQSGDLRSLARRTIEADVPEGRALAVDGTRQAHVRTGVALENVRAVEVAEGRAEATRVPTVLAPGPRNPLEDDKLAVRHWPETLPQHGVVGSVARSRRSPPTTSNGYRCSAARPSGGTPSVRFSGSRPSRRPSATGTAPTALHPRGRPRT